MMTFGHCTSFDLFICTSRTTLFINFSCVVKTHLIHLHWLKQKRQIFNSQINFGAYHHACKNKKKTKKQKNSNKKAAKKMNYAPVVCCKEVQWSMRKKFNNCITSFRIIYMSNAWDFSDHFHEMRINMRTTS